MPPETDASSLNPTRPWIYILPMVLLLAGGMFIKWPEADGGQVGVDEQQRLVLFLGLQLFAVSASLAVWFWRNGRDFFWKPSPMAVVLGITGCVVWIAIARFDGWLVQQLGLGWMVPKRTGFNPWESLSGESYRAAFLTIRFSILAVAVPLVEEIFLRGWLGRWFESESRWSQMKLNDIGKDGIIAIMVYAVISHPAEALAAIVWFGMVTWWMKRTGSLVDCIIIHAVTNLLLGIYVVQTGNWHLW